MWCSHEQGDQYERVGRHLPSQGKSRHFTAGAARALTLPSQAMSNEIPPASDFASILRNSIHRETIARMVCSACRQTNHLRVRRVLTETPLPPVLVVNAGVRTSDELDIWVDGRQGPGKKFMQPRFSVGRNGDAIVVKGLNGKETTEGAVTYELRVNLTRSCPRILRRLTLFSCRPWSCRFNRKATPLISSLSLEVSSRISSIFVLNLTPLLH